MSVYPLPYILLWVIGIIVSTWALTTTMPSVVYPWVLAWLWFNVFIAIYEVYIVWNRALFHPSKCPVDFWGTTIRQDLWMNAWHEYSCQSDRRYLDPSDFVFWIEFGNVVWVILLAAALWSGKALWIGVVLILQAYHCFLYFITLYHSKKYTFINPIKAWVYLCISALWIIIPLVCIRTLL